MGPLGFDAPNKCVSSVYDGSLEVRARTRRAQGYMKQGAAPTTYAAQHLKPLDQARSRPLSLSVERLCSYPRRACKIGLVVRILAGSLKLLWLAVKYLSESYWNT